MLDTGKLIAFGVAAAVLLSAVTYIYTSGRKAKQDEIDKQNMEALGDAVQGDDRFSACDRDGGVFDFWTGGCERPDSGHRDDSSGH